MVEVRAQRASKPRRSPVRKVVESRVHDPVRTAFSASDCRWSLIGWSHVLDHRTRSAGLPGRAVACGEGLAKTGPPTEDVEMMRLAVHWADLHIADPEFAEACFTSPKTFAGEGSPSIDEFCVPEFATMLGRTNDSAGRFLTECVEVAYRLPAAVGCGPVGSGRGVAGADHRADHPRPDPGGRDARGRAGVLVRVAAHAVAAASGGRRGPGAVHARRRAEVAGGLGGQAARHVRHRAGVVRRDDAPRGRPGDPRRPGAGRGRVVGCGAPREARVHRHRRRPPGHRAG